MAPVQELEKKGKKEAWKYYLIVQTTSAPIVLLSSS